jgi:hypothetical protein
MKLPRIENRRQYPTGPILDPAVSSAGEEPVMHPLTSAF